MWCTTFAFQPWHSAVEFKRYLVRFTHMVSGFNTLRGIMRTVYNQYDSMVRPLQKWLEEHEVKFQLNTRVTDLRFLHDSSGYSVQRIVYNHDGRADEIKIGKKDVVMVTLGSMTEAASFGSMDSAPVLNGKSHGGSWALWEKIAADQPQLPFGHPANFTDHIQESKWASFTTTLRDPAFFDSFGILRATCREKADLLLSRSPVGWRRSFYPTSLTLLVNPRMSMFFGAMVFPSISRVTS